MRKILCVFVLALTVLLSSSLVSADFKSSIKAIPECTIYNIYDDKGEVDDTYIVCEWFDGYEVYDLDGNCVEKSNNRNIPAKPKIECRNPWVEIDFPNEEYCVVYVNGKKLDKVTKKSGRSGFNAGVKYRNTDFMWEAAVPHRIYSKTEAYLSIDGVPQWYSNATYPILYTGRNAEVKSERIYYGFGDYKVTGEDTVERMPVYMAPWVGNDVYDGIEGITAADLAPKTEVVRQDVTAYYDAIKVPKSYDIKLVGPGFDAEGNLIPDAKTIIGSDINTCNPANFGIADVIGVVRDSLYGNIEYAEITWTNDTSEALYPYVDYIFLTIDGVVMDGRIEPDGYYRPCIFRYKTTYGPCNNPECPIHHGKSGTLVDYVDGVELFGEALN